MINIKDKNQCCGCTACASICPKDAISMIPDIMGFKYPKVDTSKCIECGLCEKVCAFNDNYDKSLNLKEPEIYAARHKDIHEIETSRSGATFIAISDYVLDNGGIVYGVGYKDHFKVVHKRATTKDERNEFKGSKYVQSDLGSIFKQVKEDLKKGYTVLFSGTPCQTAGLNSFVGNKLRENLILIDIVCHGVPSPNVWKDYLSYIEKKYKKNVIKVDFRDKSRIGWYGHMESFVFEDGNKIESNLYTNLFYKHIMFRQSCGVCHYTNFERPSDITLADYWGWQKTDPNINADNKGISLVLVNTDKGSKIFETIKNKYLTTISVKKENCIQPNLQHPSIINVKCLEFEHDYNCKGIHYVIKKYGNTKWQHKFKKIFIQIKNNIKKILKII